MKHTTATRTVHTQAALLKRRCASSLAKHRARAKALGIASLPYALDDLMRLAGASPTCHWCSTPVGWSTLQFDHIQPTGRGGAFTIDNTVCSCSRCNLLRGILTAEEFGLLRELLARLHPVAAEDLARRLIAGGTRYSRR